MLRRFLLGLPIWTLVVGASAAPSWFFAMGTSVPGRLFAIGLWVVIYSLVTSTEFFAERWSRPIERTAICITYGIRVLLGPMMFVVPFLALVDIWCGIASIRFSEGVAALLDPHFVATGRPQAHTISTGVATFTQGLLLSVLTFGLLTLIRAWCLAADRYAARRNRGFEVVMPSKPDDRASPQ
jgi:hypothetical protein